MSFDESYYNKIGFCSDTRNYAPEPPEYENEEDEPCLVTIEKDSFLETIEDNLIKVTDGTGNKIKAITLDDIRRILDDNIDEWDE